MSSCPLPGLPAIVPRRLKEELGRLQEQIKVLLRNHSILHHRLQQDPQNEVTSRLMGQVEEYLVFFSTEQGVLLEKVRQFLRDIEEGKYEHKQSVKTEDLEREEEDDGGKIPKPTRESSFSSKVPSSASSEGDDTGDEEEEERRPYLQYFTADNCQRGHVEEYRIPCPSPEPEEAQDTEEDQETFSLERLHEFPTLPLEQEAFLHSLDLLRIAEYRAFVNFLEDKRRRNLKRISSYVPEVSDKKLRYQSYLQNSLFSPPHLRKRRSTPSADPKQGGGGAGAGRSAYYPPPPERMGTRSHIQNQEKGGSQ